MRTVIYYITCDSVTAHHSVILASSDYEAVVARRDGIEANTDEGSCDKPHPIRHKEVML